MKKLETIHKKKTKTIYKADVFNVPEDAEKWIVARYNPDTCDLWYWGSWNEREAADRVAYDIGGLVLKKELI